MEAKKKVLSLMFTLLALVGAFVFLSVADIMKSGAVTFASVETGEGGQEPTPNGDVGEKCKVVVEKVGEGDVSLSPTEEEGLYEKGAVVKVEMTPAQDWSVGNVEGVELDEQSSFQVESDVTIVVTFVPNDIELTDETDEARDVVLSATVDLVPKDTTMTVSKVLEEDERYLLVKNLLQNREHLLIYDITLENAGLEIEEIEGGKVTLKIRLDEEFDSNKVEVYWVDVETGVRPKSEKHEFVVEGDYLVIQTSKLGLYALSQAEGFRPVPPSTDGTNKGALALAILGSATGLVLIGVMVVVFINKKKSK